MNAVNQVYFSKRAQGGSATFAQRSLNKMGVMAMILGLLLSAFSVIYYKDLNRRLFIQDQTLLQAKQNYEVQWSQLLLKQSTWSTQARIQKIATEQGMVMPSSRDIVMVENVGETFASR